MSFAAAARDDWKRCRFPRPSSVGCEFSVEITTAPRFFGRFTWTISDFSRFVVVDLRFETFIPVTGDVTPIAVVPSGQAGVDIGAGEADTTAGPAGSAEMTPSGEEVGAGVSRTGV